jgi:hypothetical protein
MASPVLLSLAYLKIHSDTNRGIFLDNFVPFIVQSLKEQQEPAINLAVLQKKLQQNFGLHIPQKVIDTILHRAKKNGYVRRDQKNWLKNTSKINSFPFAGIQKRVERIYLVLIKDFVEYSKKKHNIIFSEAEAESLFLSFISYNQIFVQNPEFAEEHLLEDLQNPTKDKKFVVGSYILDAMRDKSQIYEYIDIIVKGYMIAQVLHLPDVHETGKKFVKTKVFLDTSFIIYSLGYSGIEFQSPSLELLDLLYKNNAIICCFEHTVQEIEGILTACSQKLGTYSDSAFGRTIQHFVSIGATSSDIQLKILHLRKDIEDLRIRIEKVPDYKEEKFVAGEEEISKLLRERMPSQRDEATQRDVASLSAIYRLRRNNYSAFIENSSALFLTTSNTLAQASNEYYYKYNDRATAPPCLTDYFLTNILWLKTPNQSPDLPMKRIIADSYAAIQPSEELMERWFREIDKLSREKSISAQDYYFMRASEEAKSALMEYTFGNSNAVTNNIALIMAKAKSKLQSEIEKKYTHQLTFNEATITEYQKLLVTQKRSEGETVDRRRKRSRRLANLFINIIKAIAIVSIIFTAITTISYGEILPNNPVKDFLSTYLSSGILIIMAILITIILVLELLVSVYTGKPIVAILNSWEVNAEKKFFEFFTWLAERV